MVPTEFQLTGCTACGLELTIAQQRSRILFSEGIVLEQGGTVRAQDGAGRGPVALTRERLSGGMTTFMLSDTDYIQFLSREALAWGSRNFHMFVSVRLWLETGAGFKFMYGRMERSGG